MVISFKEPEDQKRIDSNDVKVVVKITSIHDIKKVEILVNDKVVEEFSGNKKEIEETINLADGVYEIKVRAENVKGNVKDNRVRIGVNKNWDEVAPTPQP